jgi:hypothetical protein
MKRHFSIAARCLLLLLPALPATVLADPLADLRSELDALKSSYEQRIGQLEQRIAQLEAQAPGAATAEIPPLAPAPMPAASAATAFNPALSLILAGTYSQLSTDPASYRIGGFIPSGGETGSGARGFNLGESELTIAANVDPYFFGNVTASISGDNEISVEEAYFRTTALAHGLTLKAGRFFSGIGYLNDVHAHAWDFVDQPLAYQVFLGSQFAQDGAQLKWLAPTDVFVELGVEAGSGRSFPGTTRSANGLNAASAFLHLGDDVGDSASWRSGLSWLRTDAEDRRFESLDGSNVPVTDAFSGSSQTWVTDFTWKWAPHGNPTERQLKLQGEYLHRTETGSLAFDTNVRSLVGPYRSQQSGWYVQGVYQFRPRWRAGLRYDSLDSGDPGIGPLPGAVSTVFAFPQLQSASPSRTTVMLDWNLSEFSRLRSQFAWDQARAGETDRQLFLQYLFSLGAHGAHKF